jgi:hypothetical protein
MICVMLAGCGGGSDGGVNSTPAPPVAANSNLIGPLKSESFVNDAAQDQTTTAGVSNGLTASAATATFAYQASNQTYTMTVGSHTQSFGPANVVSAQTNTQETVYQVKSGTTTDTLTLTNPGTSGQLTYEYVGAALWQGFTTGNPYTSNLYAVTYGEPTPASSVPKSGLGQYGIDVLGTYATSASLVNITGSGTLAVNFANDQVQLGGQTILGNFSGTGTLTSSGTFSGNFYLDSAGSGGMAGRFYGPAAQEVGATFHVGGGVAVAAGAIVGRSETPATSTDFTSYSGDQNFTADRARQYGSGSGTNGLGTLQVGLNGVSYLAPVATLTAPDYTTTTTLGTTALDLAAPSLNMTNVLADNAANSSGAYLLNPTATATSPSQSMTQYVRAAVYDTTSANNQFFDYFTYGYTAPTTAFPTTGSTGYQFSLDGTLANTSTAAKATEIAGNGEIVINFANGAVTTTGTVSTIGSTGPSTLGALSGSGTMSSSSSAFTSSLSVNAATAYNGNLQGNLYGPTANEIGAVFSANGSDGSNLAGVLTGALDPNYVDPNRTLLTLGKATQFVTNESGFANAIYYATIQPTTLIDSGITQIAYDPTSKTYTVSNNIYGMGGTGTENIMVTPISATFDPTRLDSANSNATFTAYAFPTYTARFFNPGANNPVIQLSYVSFADITATLVGNYDFSSTGYPAEHFLVFGIPAIQVPTTGSATYSGVVYGAGNDPALSSANITLGGTGQVNANFAAGTVSTTLTINATPVGSGVAQSLGSFTYAGAISGGNFTGSLAIANTTNGTLFGSFYGPNAAEVGAAFNLSVPGNATGQGNFAGVIVGKKN